ncbi:MAG: hypothetical protein MUE36_08765 [Acidimicrobiales bacterium]|nr:hypothetical protein [Acidimicrobiales bacterium]
MAKIDDLLERLAVDDDFRRAVEQDPAAALEAYDLGDADLVRVDAALRTPSDAMDTFFSPVRSDPERGLPDAADRGPSPEGAS